MEKQIEIENEEDEISLLEMFAVLIRNRKLIVFGTLIVTFLAGLYLFVLPLCFKKSNSQSATVTYSVDVRTMPVSISAKLPNNEKISPLYLSTYNTQRLPFLVDQIKAHNIFSDVEMTDYQFNSFVQGLLKDGKIKVTSSPLGNSYDIILSISMEKIYDSTVLVKSIVASTEKSVEEYYMPLIQTLSQNTNNSIEKATSIATSTSDMSSIQGLQDLAVEIEEFSQSFEGFLVLREEPFVVPEGRGRVKKLLIIFLGSFVVFVVAAFIKNVVRNIKADPESNKLISDAWKEGK